MLAEAKYQRQKKRTHQSHLSRGQITVAPSLMNSIDWLKLHSWQPEMTRGAWSHVRAHVSNSRWTQLRSARHRFSLIVDSLTRVSWLCAIADLSLAAATRLDTLPQRYTVYCRTVRCFLPGSAHMQTTPEEVTVFSSCLSKSESSRTVSKWTEQHEAFIKKASYNMSVWWSLCWVIISLLQQTVCSLWRGCFFYYYWR